LKLITTRGQIKEAVTGLGKIISGKCTLPVLAHVRVHADGQGATATGSDLEQVAEYEFGDVQVHGEGDCIVPLAALKPLAKGSAKDTIEIEAEAPDRVTVVNSVGGHAVRQPVAALEADEWPDVAVDVKTAPVPHFLDIYRRLQTSASRDETRYVLNGVCLDVTHKQDNGSVMVATDGRRLGFQNTMNLPVDESCILRLSKFLSWSKLPSDAEVGLTEIKDVKWIGVKAGPWTFHTRAIDGTYPNWRQVVPSFQGDEHVITLSAQDAEVLHQAIPSLPGEEETLLVGQHGKVTVYARGAEDQEWTTLELPDSTFNGDVAYVSLNRKFVYQALAAGFMRSLRFADELCPVYSEDGSGGVMVIMPMRSSPPDHIEKAVAERREQGGKESANEPVADQRSDPPTSGTNADGKPAQVPKPKKKRRKNKVATEQKDESPALDRVLEACDTARTKVKEAGQALTDLSKAIRDASREQKAQEKEVEAAKAAIKKVQSLKLAA